MEKNEISRALEDLANEIERAPIELVGVKVSVESGQGGNATGLEIAVSAGQEGSSSTGMKVSVTSNEDYKRHASALVDELRSAAEAAKDQKPAAGWIKSLLQRVRALGNKALEKAVETASTELVKQYGAALVAGAVS